MLTNWHAGQMTIINIQKESDNHTPLFPHDLSPNSSANTTCFRGLSNAIHLHFFGTHDVLGDHHWMVTADLTGVDSGGFVSAWISFAAKDGEAAPGCGGAVDG